VTRPPWRPETLNLTLINNQLECRSAGLARISARLSYCNAPLLYCIPALSYRKRGMQYDSARLSHCNARMSYCNPGLQSCNAAMQHRFSALSYCKRAMQYDIAGMLSCNAGVLYCIAAKSYCNAHVSYCNPALRSCNRRGWLRLRSRRSAAANEITATHACMLTPHALAKACGAHTPWPLSHFFLAIPIQIGLGTALRIAGIVDRAVLRLFEASLLGVLAFALRLSLLAVRRTVGLPIGRT
jgi:hypothetical protein